MIKFKPKETFFLILIFIIAIYIRVKKLAIEGFGFNSDDAIYMTMARRFSEGNFKAIIHPHWFPLYPLFAVFLNNFTNSWAITSRLVSVIAGSLLIFPIYFLSKEISGKLGGFLSSLLIVFSIPLIMSSTMGLAESLYILLLWTGIFLLILSFDKKGKKLYYLAGLFFGLSVLTKSEGIMTLLSYCFFVFVDFVLSVFKTKNIKQLFNEKSIVSLFVLLGFLTIYLPHKYFVKKYYPGTKISSKVTAHFNLSSPFNLNKNSYSTWAQDIWSLDTFDQNSEIFKQNGLIKPVFIKSLFDNMFKRISNIFGYFYRIYFNLPIIILAILGLIFLMLDKNKKKGYFILSFFSVLFFLVMFFLPSSQDRYGYFMIPLLFILTSNAISFVVSKVKKPYFIFLLLLLVSYFICYKKMMYVKNIFSKQDYLNQEPTSREITDKWIRDNYPNSIVMARHEGSVFYNRSKLIYSPVVESYQELLDYAKKWNVDLIIANDDEIYTKYKYLYLKPQDYPGLKMVFNSGTRWVLYKLVK